MPASRFQKPLFPVLCASVLVAAAGCAGSRPVDDSTTPVTKQAYPGFLQVLGKTGDVQPLCALTVVLRNDSGIPQGQALVRLEWLDAQGTVLAESEILMIKTKPGQVTGKNDVLQVTCDRVDRVRVRSAEWVLGWDIASTTIVPITGVDGAELRFGWNATQGRYLALSTEP